MRITANLLMAVLAVALANDSPARSADAVYWTDLGEASPAVAQVAWAVDACSRTDDCGETPEDLKESPVPELADPWSDDAKCDEESSCGCGLWGRLRCCLPGCLCTCCGYDPCCRKWTVTGGAIILNRDLGSGTVFVNDQDQPGGTTYFQSDDYDLGTQGGPYFDIIRHGDYVDFQVRYWEIDDWSDTVGPVQAPGGVVYRFNPPVPFMVGPTVLTSTYTSELHSFEANVRRRFTPRCTGLIGFRTLELDEALVFNGRVFDAFNTTASTATQNRLYGMQIGLDGTLYRHNRLSVEGWGRAGIFANNMDARATFISPGQKFQRSNEDCDAAFAADAGLFAVYQLTPCWAIRLGYQAFWMDGVTTAAGQMSNTSPLQGPYITTPPTMDKDSVFAHGATVALEYYWCGGCGGGGKGKGK